jgi:hypothetical protein
LFAGCLRGVFGGIAALKASTPAKMLNNVLGNDSYRGAALGTPEGFGLPPHRLMLGHERSID